MAASSLPNSSSNSSSENRKPEITLRKFSHADEEIWSIHTISEEILPCLLEYHNKMKKRFADLQNEDRLCESLSAINLGLRHIAETIEKFHDSEKSANELVKALLPLYLSYIQIEEVENTHKETIAKLEIEEDGESEAKLSPEFIRKLIDEIHEAISKLKGKIKIPADPVDADGRRQVQIEIESLVQAAGNADGPQLEPIRSSAHISSQTEEFTKKKKSQTEELRKVKQICNLLDNEDNKTKQCLFYLSVFPDDFPVRKTDLTLWWEQEELIPEEEDPGEFVQSTLRRFEEMSLVEPVMKGFKMLPMARRIVNFLARRDNFFHIDAEGNFQLPKSSKSEIALLLSTKKSSQYEIRNRDPKDLVTLFNVNESLVDIQKSWLSKATKLRVLQLGSWHESKNQTEVTNIDFLKSFWYLTGLRYLSFSRISGIHELPPQMFSQLKQLRTLELKGCQDLTKVPNEIGVLENLTHLDMSECYLLQSLPKEIGNLTKLQVLKGLMIWDTEFGCKISDLKKLSKLRKLSIFGSMGTVAKDFSGLSDLNALRSLTITWIRKGMMLPAEESSKGNVIRRFFTKQKRRNGSSNEGKSSGTPVMADESKVSIPELEKLDLLCYPEPELPSWIDRSEMKKLKKLYIRGGKLRSLGTEVEKVSWNVEVLRLKFLQELELNWEQRTRHFPHLKYVEKIKCPNLESFPCDEYGIWTSDQWGKS